MDCTTIHNAATKIVDNIKVIDGSINALQNKQDIISTSDMSMANSHEGKLKIEEIGGKCKQVTTTGKNLFDASKAVDNKYQNFNVTDNNYEISDNNNYWITGLIAVKPNTDYSVGVTSSGAYYSDEVTPLEGRSVYNKTKFTTPEGANYVQLTYEKVSVPFGTNIMLNEGSTLLPWEPYTGGQPSPNPDYPQEIKKTVVSEIKTMGSNWLDVSKIDTGGSESCTIEGEGKKITVTSKLPWSGVRFDAMRLRGKSFYLVCDNITASGSYAIDVNYKSNGVGAYEPVNSGIITIPKEATTAYVRIIANNTNNTLDTASSISVENLRIVESKDTPWQPYTESVIKLSEPIELYGIGDVKDTIDDGKIVRTCGVKVFDGSENIIIQEAGSNDTLYLLCECPELLLNSSIYIVSGAMCNRLTEQIPDYLWNNSVNGFAVNTTTWYPIRFRLGADITSVELAKARLKEWYDAGDPMTVVYELAEPVTEPLPLIDQAALNGLSTYDGITYLEFDSEIEPTFQAEYGVTEIGGRVLEDLMTGLNSEILAQSDADRITALESTIVNNI